MNYGKLTAQKIENLQPEGGRRRRISDGRRLYVVAMPSGIKRWECEYTQDGREHRQALGLWPEVGISEARRRHADLLARIRSGFSPGRHAATKPSSMRTVGLFAGIGGIEHGLEAGCDAKPVLLCELRPEAQAVLRRRFPEAQIVSDVREMEALPEAVDLLAAGFPCQDISVVGPKLGLAGERSFLVGEVFRLLEQAPQCPELLLLENVPNIITIGNGSFMRFLTDHISALGYRWSYRLIDPRSLGIPHRRPRLFLLASRTVAPAAVLFPADEEPAARIEDNPGAGAEAAAYGCYWTSGRIGIGWARESIPPLKASAPPATAVWDVSRNVFGLPALEDAERLQGFPDGWTDAVPAHARWQLLGNAVNVAVSRWIGDRLRTGGDGGPRPERVRRIYPGVWPQAAFGGASGIWAVDASAYPAGTTYTSILEFLKTPLKLLSLPAALGFRRRVLSSTAVHYPERFLQSLDTFLKHEHGWNRED